MTKIVNFIFSASFFYILLLLAGVGYILKLLFESTITFDVLAFLIPFVVSGLFILFFINKVKGHKK